MILLRISGLELNPGPNFNLAILNSRSVCNKAAIIRDIIADHSIQILAISETWINKDDPDAIKMAAVPQGYAVLHEPRQSGP